MGKDKETNKQRYQRQTFPLSKFSCILFSILFAFLIRALNMLILLEPEFIYIVTVSVDSSEGPGTNTIVSKRENVFCLSSDLKVDFWNITSLSYIIVELY